MGVLFLFILLSSFAFAVCSAQNQVTAITLWQFGQGRLLAADFTMPLEPLGTAADGSETTYLYQALNEVTVTTTNEAGLLTILTTPIPTPRTIIASASGWAEPFSNGAIICNLIDSDFGACTIGTGIANSGAPTPEVLQVALTVSLPSESSATPILSTPSLPLPTFVPNPSPTSSGTSDQTLSPNSSQPPVGTIVSATVIPLVILAIGVGLFVTWRRRLRRAHQLKPASISIDLEMASEVRPGRKGPFAPQAFYTSPQPQPHPASVILGPPNGAGSWTDIDTRSRPSVSIPQSISQASQGASWASQSVSATSPGDTQYLAMRMGEISERLSRLETEGPPLQERPPPSYEGDV